MIRRRLLRKALPLRRRGQVRHKTAAATRRAPVRLPSAPGERRKETP